MFNPIPQDVRSISNALSQIYPNHVQNISNTYVCVRVCARVCACVYVCERRGGAVMLPEEYVRRGVRKDVRRGVRLDAFGDYHEFVSIGRLIRLLVEVRLCIDI